MSTLNLPELEECVQPLYHSEFQKTERFSATSRHSLLSSSHELRHTSHHNVMIHTYIQTEHRGPTFLIELGLGVHQLLGQ